MLATIPAHKSWVRDRLYHSCSQSVGLVDIAETAVMSFIWEDRR
jgi:hypothetical protein